MPTLTRGDVLYVPIAVSRLQVEQAAKAGTLDALLESMLDNARLLLKDGADEWLNSQEVTCSKS